MDTPSPPVGADLRGCVIHRRYRSPGSEDKLSYIPRLPLTIQFLAVRGARARDGSGPPSRVANPARLPPLTDPDHHSERCLPILTAGINLSMILIRNHRDLPRGVR